MENEKSFDELTANQIVAALIADDEDLKDFEEELIETISAMKKGDYSKARETKIAISPVAETRNRLNLSQIKFAEILGVSASAVRSWEQGKRQPSGSAQKLLTLLSNRPELVLELA